MYEEHHVVQDMLVRALPRPCHLHIYKQSDTTTP